MGNRILVTGGCGMIGSNLVKRLVKEGNDVYVIDNLWRGKLEYLNDETGKPVIDLDTHFFNIDLSVGNECDRVVFNELFPALPESAYGWSKLMGQIELGFLEKETGIPCCTLMFHNVYGSPCDYGERSQVIPALIRKAVNYPKEPFNVWGSGSQGRAFIHVDDIVEALCLALEKGWEHGYIQIGPSVCTSIKEIAETIVKISGKNIEIVYDTTKPEGDKARSADYTKAKTILGWEPKVALEDGLRQQYEWVKSQIEKSGCNQ